jgi:hypothetical protein
MWNGPRRSPSAPHWIPHLPLHQASLPGKRGLIEDGRPRAQDPVDGQDVAFLHDQGVAHEHMLDRYAVHGTVLQPMGHTRRPTQERRQLPLGEIRRVFFECLTCGDHETDHRPGQVFTEYQRPDDGEECDDIHAGRAPRKNGKKTRG